MRKALPPLSLLLFAFPSALVAQEFRAARTVWASAPAEVPALASEIDLMLDTGHLQLERSQADGTFPGRHHERMNQYHQGVRVFGGQLVWQKQSGLVGQTSNSSSGVLRRKRR